MCVCVCVCVCMYVCVCVCECMYVCMCLHIMYVCVLRMYVQFGEKLLDVNFGAYYRCVMVFAFCSKVKSDAEFVGDDQFLQKGVQMPIFWPFGPQWGPKPVWEHFFLYE